MPNSIFGDIAELGDRAVSACAALELLAGNIKRVKDGDDALALGYGIEIQIKAILTARLHARQANQNGNAADLTYRRGVLDNVDVDPETSVIRLGGRT